jgi:hypothetical protein
LGWISSLILVKKFKPYLLLYGTATIKRCMEK